MVRVKSMGRVFHKLASILIQLSKCNELSIIGVIIKETGSDLHVFRQKNKNRWAFTSLIEPDVLRLSMYFT